MGTHADRRRGDTDMKSPTSLRFLLPRTAVAVALAGLALVAQAASRDAKKPERRPPPTGAQMSEIPAGVDSGTPATSNSMQLGMPVPPSQQTGDQGAQNRNSAAGRAAARKGPSDAASNAYAKPIGPVVTTTQKKPPATSTTAAAKPAASAPTR
jgi:hypothetical protein